MVAPQTNFEREILALLSDPSCSTLSDQVSRWNDKNYRRVIRQLRDWERGGAETYVIAGEVVCVSLEGLVFRDKVIGKAYAGFGVDPEARVKEWQRRFALLEAGQVRVPRAYGVARGVLFTQSIDFSFEEWVHSVGPPSSQLASQLLALARGLDFLRAEPIVLLGDLRCEEGLVYLVDVGEDLGSIPGESSRPTRCRELVLKELRSSFPTIAISFEALLEEDCDAAKHVRDD